MSPRRLLFPVLVALSLVLVAEGCGGGGSGHRPSVGALRVTAEFPAREVPEDVSGRVIPEGAESIYVAVTNAAGALLGEALLVRPDGGGQSPRDVIPGQIQPAAQVSATIDNLPLGPAVVTAEAFGPTLVDAASARPNRPSLASATTQVNIGPGVNDLALSLVSSVAQVEVGPPTADVGVGQTQQFWATARDGDGAVLVGATFDWSSDDIGVATVDPFGLALGTGPGTCNITATEKASGVQGSAQLNVGGAASGDVLIVQDQSPWGYNPNPTVCTGLGLTYSMITSGALAATNLSGFDVVVVAGQQNPTFYSNIVSALPQIDTYITNGGVYLVHMATYDLAPAGIVPGGGNIAWTQVYGTNIDIINPLSGLITGPGGTITNTNLDGGNESYHGYADATSLPLQADAILSTGNPSQVVFFDYPYASGDVLVSTIPVEWYNAGTAGSQPNIGSIYHYNEFEYAVTMAQTGP